MLVCVLALAVTTGCSDDDDSGTGPDGGGTFTAKIDGQDWAATLITGVNTNGVINIVGSAPNTTTGTNMQINIAGMLTEGTTTYPSFTSTFTYGAGNAAGADAYVATAGQLVISDLDDSHVEGTFSVTVTQSGSGNTVSITEGSFHVEF